VRKRDKGTVTNVRRLAFNQRTLLSSRPRERGLADETVRHRLCDLISTLILILLPRAHEPGNALMSKTVDNTAIRPYRTLRFGGKHEATRGTMHRYLPPVDEREEAPLSLDLFTGKTRYKLPASHHRSRTDYAWRYLHRNTILLPLLLYPPL